ncbi:hypothetical protein [Herbidospora sp. NBRC 101105]|uniref:hypothetical protein n=1 Tax=Herbidospora sp. NBRC 101105 TaxID=3032195 RepID=UPI0024A13941|nr:hypothetical protein [Herbidospora sp. NBRC 101105]GLX92942.1 hypothetical protein Hesp01_08920 [Herbidospora sp. NBRC 101105]
MTAAIGALGGAVWTKTQDAAAEGVVGWGRRLLGRVAEREEGRPALESAVADVAADVQQMLAAATPIIAGAGSQVISGSYIGGDAFQIGSAGSVSIHRRPPST